MNLGFVWDLRSELRRGFTLLETIVYVALLGLVMIVVVNFLIEISGVYQRARVERDAVSNARSILETAGKSIAESQEVYQPTSKFQQNLGQLSLVTATNPTAEHSTGFLDFWVDGGRLWMRQEGQTAIPLSAPSVRVSKWYLEWVLQGLEREAVKITLEVDSASTKYPSTITLNSSVALRGNY